MSSTSKKKKVATAVAATAITAAVLLTGTYAWQSISQTAVNIASDTVNPGGRLHDDFNGTNKDVYVENFADEQIFARIRLSEYFEVGQGAGIDLEGTDRNVEVLTKYTNDEGAETVSSYGEQSTWSIHKFDETEEYWTWTTGGETIYMPTFNKNKDSLEADINGTYDSVDTEGNRYSDYEAYTAGVELDGTAIYDADPNDTDEVKESDVAAAEAAGNVTTATETHTAKATGNATLMSMQDWIDAGSVPGPYWVYDTDGWVYYAMPIEAGTATGLLLDGIELTGAVDDNWYYAINVEAQFITADDIGTPADGESTGTGFYDLSKGTEPSAEALALLKAIGVNTGATSEEEPAEPEYAITVLSRTNSDGYTEQFGGRFADGEEWTLALTKDGVALENVTWSMELIDGGGNTQDNTLEGSAIDPNTGVITIAEGEATYQSGTYTSAVYHLIEITAVSDEIELSEKFFINNNLYASDLYFYEDGTYVGMTEGNNVYSENLIVGTKYDVVVRLWDQDTYSDKYSDMIDPIIIDDIVTITDADGNEVDSSVATFENNEFIAYQPGDYTIIADGVASNWDIYLNTSITVSETTTE